jgi:DNA-binding response OmpR family regulator
MFAWLTDAGCDVAVVSTFAAARNHLESDPALLVSEVRLAEHNGLHLALRARHRDIPAVILGTSDPVLERDAKELGAVYLTSEVTRQRLLAIIAPVIAAAQNAPPAPRPAATNLSFLSWREFSGPLGAVSESLSLRRRLLS